MAKKYNKHSSTFKLKVAIEALKEKKTAAELMQEFSISSSQLFAWRKQLIADGVKAFEDSNNKEKVLQEEIDKLHRVIGKQTAEIDLTVQYNAYPYL